MAGKHEMLPCQLLALLMFSLLLKNEHGLKEHQNNNLIDLRTNDEHDL